MQFYYPWPYLGYVYHFGIFTQVQIMHMSHVWWGLATLIPVMLQTLFLIPHWWRIESTKKRRILTFPIVILQLWPQIRVARLLYLGWKKHKNWANENSLYQKNVSGIGLTKPFHFFSKENCMRQIP